VFNEREAQPLLEYTSWHNDTCEDCERSMMDRFGGYTTQLCESCADTFELEMRSGKVRVVDDINVGRELAAIEHLARD
jgi:hypothetical protein